MNLGRMYGLFLRHFFLITRSFPRILDLIYWPTIQITLWGFISNFFSTYSSYYSNAVGVILTCAILYDFLFRTSIGFNKPNIIPIVVVFPDPFGPSKPIISFSLISKLIFFTASFVP